MPWRGAAYLTSAPFSYALTHPTEVVALAHTIHHPVFHLVSHSFSLRVHPPPTTQDTYLRLSLPHLFLFPKLDPSTSEGPGPGKLDLHDAGSWVTASWVLPSLTYCPASPYGY
ncbi:hypothetical protein BDP55DRAFT_417966 [Colletotrichum godetiae]|uniref:Uncharacterized protein n=1 Tax=Colletotrichum godetiae TaxID=1209918 RepID=A0AAJ0EQP4_9PEZI|nr:uncharacterized protein BDP55DRAFT_417966 [Colletotrichum godetiae]KAK1657784.1 hypothetical protein BDP55DRAFT_417966 [Colletotrichum godetiae]